TNLEELNVLLEKISIDMKRENGKLIVILDGEDVSEEIRTPKVDSCVAKYAAIACVRNKITPLQRKMGENGKVIMEGRDIGTVVFPNADVKIYLDASVEERAKRRYKQDIEKGINISYEEVLEEIKKRHKLETEREIAPLVQAEDAIYVDSSNLTIEQVVEKIIDIIKEKGYED
ncbi:MAG: (d)CMP kinase, partial [Clostridia bacterium]|nr:(d)CMP kinase [Clostridia bacterium]